MLPPANASHFQTGQFTAFSHRRSYGVTGSRKSKYYGCAGRLRKPKKGQKRCSLPLVRKERLESRVLQKLADFFTDDEKFQKALALANTNLASRGAELAKLERDEKKLLRDDTACQQKLEHLVDAIADGVIAREDARAKRQAIAKEEARIEKSKEELASKRTALSRSKEQVESIQRTRRRLRGFMARWKKLAELPDQEKQDFLRMLLPPDSGSRIIVHRWKEEDWIADEDTGPLPKNAFEVEISGMLPLERVELEYAVLGGALAVP